ncbi:hypothetical protein TrispH2_002232 [Trichoplax sp. H2]|nr:hypothetical protein TrispH2_002232 [Trichoplax sp. H2]|eukprot:RDD45744.1 hypothetical protein TrispH2_002232 [Trichoplax sp. H2]
MAALAIVELAVEKELARSIDLPDFSCRRSNIQQAIAIRAVAATIGIESNVFNIPAGSFCRSVIDFQLADGWSTRLDGGMDALGQTEVTDSNCVEQSGHRRVMPLGSSLLRARGSPIALSCCAPLRFVFPGLRQMWQKEKENAMVEKKWACRTSQCDLCQWSMLSVPCHVLF